MFCRLAVLALSALPMLSCVTTTAAGSRVRVTSNPDVVKGCEFLGNVKATSGWGGPAGTGLAGSNTEKTLQNKTAQLSGNIVFVVASGIHASGEAYRCAAPSRPRGPTSHGRGRAQEVGAERQ